MIQYVFRNSAPGRLDDFLREELPGAIQKEISNSKIRRLIISGSVRVNDEQTRLPAFRLRQGSHVAVSIDEEKLFFEKAPNDISFELTEKDVLFEDDAIIVVNKPAFFPTEAGIVGSRDNLHAAVIRYLWAKNPSLKNPPYAGIMHRLDRETSGVILFTKSRAANKGCHDMFENHRKYDYALSLRIDAARRIGIENIRNHKLNSLAQEKEQMEAQYRQSKQICPDFYLELLAHME